MNTYDLIYEVVRQIPYGKVASYGQIAALAGNPKWSRVVGYALHVCPESLNLPCHRVVTKDGGVSKAFDHGVPDTQRMLLEDEGVEFSGGKVIMAEYQWCGPCV